MLGGDRVARRYRRGRSRRNYTIGAVVALTGGAAYWTFVSGRAADPSSPDGLLASRAPLASDRPFSTGDNPYQADVPEKGANDPAGRSGPVDGSAAPPAAAGSAAADQSRIRQLIAAGRDELGRGHWIAARQHLSEAYTLGPPPEELTELRAELTRIGDETVFSPRLYPDDPLVGRYVIQPSETLGQIAKAHDVTAELLARINGIPNVNRVNAGQTIKVVRGPFHAAIDKSRYTMDVLLQGTFVRAYRVGLGADDSTPTGDWSVKVKLKDPTYYSPRGGSVIQSDDPANPLGERWIGLEGVGGNAVGQMRYGIHGTIEPASIGRSVSLGCIRLHNADVEFFFDLMIPGKSQVVIR